MKKYISIITLVIILIFTYQLIRPFRTENDLKVLASQEFEGILSSENQNNDSDLNNYKGPLVHDNLNENSKEFTWFKSLKWGDSAKISITIFKSLDSFSFRDKFFNPKINLNRFWLYKNIKSDFTLKSILEKKFSNNNINYSNLILKKNSIEQKYYYCIDSKKISFYLNQGYFIYNEDNNSFSFFEKIADIVFEKETFYSTDCRIELDLNNNLVITPIMPY